MIINNLNDNMIRITLFNDAFFFKKNNNQRYFNIIMTMKFFYFGSMNSRENIFFIKEYII